MNFARVVVTDAPQRGQLTGLRGGLACTAGGILLGAKDGAIRVTGPAAGILGLRPAQRVGMWQEHGSVRIGPYVGIMTNKRPGSVPGFAGLRGRRENYTALTRMARQMGAVAFVFAAEDVDFRRRRVQGYTLRGCKWVLTEFPLPDVVYNRVPDRKSEVSLPVVKVKRQIGQLHPTVKLFNPQFFSKWRLYRQLAGNPELRQYVPETRICRGPADIITLLHKHGMVYLKPKDTFAGRGIMRVLLRQGKYVLSYKQGRLYRNESHADGVALTRAFTARRCSGVYLVQQGLYLAKFRGAIFDVRVLVQKNGRGQWEVTGMGVRVAARGGITTHVPNGGYIAPMEEVITEVFGESAAHPHGLCLEVRQLALKVATAVEHDVGGVLGEMSMDIGITTEKQCYVFEANAKPMKFDEPTIRVTSLRRIVAFSRYLAGYRDGGGEISVNT